MSKEFLESAAEKVKNEGLKGIFKTLEANNYKTYRGIVMDLFDFEEELTEESKLSKSDQQYIFALLYQKRILEANMNTPKFEGYDDKNVFVEISQDQCKTEYQKRFYDAYYSTEPSKDWVENTFGKFQGDERTKKIKEALMKYDNMEYCANPIDLKYLLEKEPKIFDSELIKHILITRFVASNLDNVTFKRLPHSKKVVELLLNKLDKQQILKIVDVCMDGLYVIYDDKEYKDTKSYKYFVYNGNPLIGKITEDYGVRLASDPVLQIILENYTHKNDFKDKSYKDKMPPILKGFASRYGDFTVDKLAPLIIQFIKNGFITKDLLNTKIEVSKYETERKQKKIKGSILDLLFNDTYNTYGYMKELFKEIFDMKDLNGSFVYTNSKLTSFLRDAEPEENDTNDQITIKKGQTTILTEYLDEKRPALLLIKKYQNLNAKEKTNVGEYVLKKMELCYSLSSIMKNITQDYETVPQNIERLKEKFKEFYKKNPSYYEQLSPSHIMSLFGFNIRYVEDEELKKNILNSINNMQNDLSKQFGIVEAKKITLRLFTDYEKDDGFDAVSNRIIKDEKLENYGVDWVKGIIKNYYDQKSKLKENWKDLLDKDIEQLEEK